MSVNLDANSPFIDLNFYRSSNPDLAQNGVTTNQQAFEHLRDNGVREGRRFSPFVDINFYLNSHSDLKAAFGNDYERAFQHLITNGVTDQRQFSVSFNPTYYRSTHPDLDSVARQNNWNNVNLLEHFKGSGLAEERASSQYFDVKYYLNNNSDLQAAGFNYQLAYDHFIRIGYPVEGRYGTPNGYPAAARDDRIGTAVPPAAESSANPADYNLEGVWQQIDPDPVTGSWSGTANINFVNRQTRQSLPLTILDNDAVEGDQTIIWTISDNAPFGFSQPTYTFNESQANNQEGFIDIPNAVELSLGSFIKTATITIKDNDFGVSSTDVPRSIPDNSTITSNLEVSGLSGVVEDVNVTLDIAHTNTADLDVFLISPTGTQVTLFTDVGGSGDNFTNTSLNDSASTLISLGSAPFTGSFAPQDSLSAFDGQNPNGTWSLRVVDDATQAVGTLNSWSLFFSL